MTDSTLAARRRSERRFHIRLAVGLTLWAAFVSWVGFNFGWQLAQSQGQPAVVVVVVHMAPP